MVRIIKRAAKRLLRGPALGPIAALATACHDSRPNALRVLMYHRVDELDAAPHLAPETLSATPNEFAVQMQLLREQFQPVSIEQVCEAVRDREVLPPRAVLVTFDDAYLDFAQHAWPVLKRYEVPALLFVPSLFPDSRRRVFWWDSLHWVVQHADRDSQLRTPLGNWPIATPAERADSYRRITGGLRQMQFSEAQEMLADLTDHCTTPPPDRQVLSWDALRRLKTQGLAIGPHTQTHPILDRLPLAEARQEIAQSYRDLQRELGGCAPALAYPGGFTNHAVTTATREGGLALAFTTRRGANIIGQSDPFLLSRINVGVATPARLVQTQLSLPAGIFNTMSRFAS